MRIVFYMSCKMKNAVFLGRCIVCLVFLTQKISCKSIVGVVLRPVNVLRRGTAGTKCYVTS